MRKRLGWSAQQRRCSVWRRPCGLVALAAFGWLSGCGEAATTLDGKTDAGPAEEVAVVDAGQDADQDAGHDTAKDSTQDVALDAAADVAAEVVQDSVADAPTDAEVGSDATDLPEVDAAPDTTTPDVAWWQDLQQETPPPLAVVGQVPCLDYDGVADGTTDEYVLPSGLFKEHIVWLYTHGYTVLTMQQYLERLDDADFGQKGLPPRTVLLFADVTSGTFIKNAWPVLYPLGYRITLGIETALIGEPWAMSVAQLKGLEKLGVEIASHSHSHPDLTLLTPKQLEDEVAGSRKKLQAYGFAVPHFIHPYGMRNATVDQAVVDAGYTAARSTGAPTIAGGGYATLDPKRRLALGCALPTQNTSVAELAAYLDNPRIELEDVVSTLADVGSEGIVERSDFAHDHYLSTTLPDKGDKVRLRLLVNQAGSYDLTFHVKVGFPGVPDGCNDSYLYRIGGTQLTPVLLGADADEPPYIVWGRHRLAGLKLDKGVVDLEIESDGNWDVVLDWLEVTPAN